MRSTWIKVLLTAVVGFICGMLIMKTIVDSSVQKQTEVSEEIRSTDDIEAFVDDPEEKTESAQLEDNVEYSQQDNELPIEMMEAEIVDEIPNDSLESYGTEARNESAPDDSSEESADTEEYELPRD